MPQGDLNNLNLDQPLNIKAYQYDIVCNGIELSSGAIRNHIPELMYKLFSVAGYDKKNVDQKFCRLHKQIVVYKIQHKENCKIL